jgi:AcrR family transcriptional regulator
VKSTTVRHDGATEQRILDAAAAVFLRRGTAGARMQEIAEEAGVNHALLHYYYRSKARLAEAVFVQAAARLMPAIVALMASDESIEDKVAQAIAIELDHLSRNPLLPAYLISEVNHHPERVQQLMTSIAGAEPGNLGKRVTAVLRRQIAERVREGTMRLISPEEFMVNLMSLCIFPFAARPLLGAVLGLDARAFTRFIDERRSALPAFFLNGLRP